MVKKRVKLALIILALAIVLTATGLVFVTGRLSRGLDYSTSILLNWDIKLPGNYEIIYEADTGPSPFGDGAHYHIFYYPDGIAESFLGDFEHEKDLEVEAAAETIIGYMDIDSERVIDFGVTYYWQAIIRAPGDYTVGEMYLIYQPDNNCLYVIDHNI